MAIARARRLVKRGSPTVDKEYLDKSEKLWEVVSEACEDISSKMNNLDRQTLRKVKINLDRARTEIENAKAMADYYHDIRAEQSTAGPGGHRRRR